MKKVLFILSIFLFAAQAQGVIITTPPADKNIAPRANAEGTGYTPPSQNTQKVQPRPPQSPQPVYYENGMPVYANSPTPSEKTCRDDFGNVIKCPAKAANTNINPAGRVLPY